MAAADTFLVAVPNAKVLIMAMPPLEVNLFCLGLSWTEQWDMWLTG